MVGILGDCEFFRASNLFLRSLILNFFVFYLCCMLLERSYWLTCYLFGRKLDCRSFRTTGAENTVTRSTVEKPIRYSKSSNYLSMVPLSSAILLLTAALGGTTCPKDTFLQHLEGNSSRCCEMCPAGHFVKLPCTATTSTTCEQCKPDTFMDTKTAERQCKSCTSAKCSPSQVVLHICNTTHDLICGCPEGQFLRAGISICVNCTACKEGEGVKEKCSTEKDTVCHPCLPGTFSSTDSATEKCQSCTKCKVNQLVSRGCTTKMDSLCRDLPGHDKTSKYETPTTNSETSPTMVTVKRKQENTYTVPVIVCAALFLIVSVGVLCYWWRRHHRADNLVNNNNGRGNANAEEERGMALLQFPPETPPRARSRHQRRGTRKKTAAREGSSSGSGSGSSSCSLQEEGKSIITSTLVRDLSYDVVLEIATLLNPKGRNNWTRLAGRMGYSQADVNSFGIDPCESTQKLLGDWGTRDSSTVELLHKLLKEIKRDDAAEILEARR